MNMDDLFTYNASISACGNAKQWKCALSLIPVLRDQRLKPQLITYNTVISACENQWWIVKGILEEVDKLALERDATRSELKYSVFFRHFLCLWSPVSRMSERGSFFRPVMGNSSGTHIRYPTAQIPTRGSTTSTSSKKRKPSKLSKLHSIFGSSKFCSEASQVITFNASIKACGPCPGELRNRENQRSWSRMDLLRVLTLSPMFHVHIMLPLKISTKMCSLRQCHALRCAEWQEALHLFREVRVLSMEEGKLVSHGESWWFHDLIKRGRPVGLDVTLVVQYFCRKGHVSIIHGNVLFDMVVATQAFLTCYENHRRTKWHTLLWWVSVVCLGNGKECWSCWTLATCSHGCLNIYQPPKVLVFESEIGGPWTNREKPDFLRRTPNFVVHGSIWR